MLLFVAVFVSLWAAGGTQPVAAQTNPAFFDRWELVGDSRPYGLQLKDGKIIEAGIVRRYQLVRDLGDRVVLLVWPSKSEETAGSPVAYTFVALTLESRKPLGNGENRVYLQFAPCEVRKRNAGTFDTRDMDKAWEQLLAQTRACGLRKGGRELGFGWGGLTFERLRPATRQRQPSDVQFDPAFLARWQSRSRLEPYSLQIQGDMIVEPDLVRKYRLIRDLGKRIVLLVWPSQSQVLEEARAPIAFSFVTLTLKPWEPIGAGTERQYMEYGYCGVGTRGADDFSTHDMDALWQDLLAGTKGCGLKEKGWKFGYGWGRTLFIRKRLMAVSPQP